MLKKRNLIFLLITQLLWVHSFSANPSEQVASSNQESITTNTYNIGIISITEEIRPKIGYKIIQQIETALQDQTINGVLIHIDSGGGTAGTSALIQRSLEELNATKPTITLIESFCCSGAYVIATGTGWIIAPPMAEVGGIGVVRTIVRQKKNQKVTIDGHEADVKYELFYKGKEKVITNELADELTKKEKEIINKKLELLYQILCAGISKSRNLSLEKSDEWAEGKVFDSFQALKIGLIDEVGGFPETKAHFKKIFASGTPEKDIKLSFSLVA